MADATCGLHPDCAAQSMTVHYCPTIRLDGVEAHGVTVAGTIWPLDRDSHLWDGQYAVETAEGIDGPYQLGQSTEAEVRARYLGIARDHAVYPD